MLKKQNFGESEVGQGGLLLYLDQEEGDPVGLEGTGKFHIANFGFDLTYVLTLLVGLQQQDKTLHQTHSPAFTPLHSPSELSPPHQHPLHQL